MSTEVYRTHHDGKDIVFSPDAFLRFPLVVKKVNEKIGLGIFPLTTIPEGAVIFSFCGMVLPEEEAGELDLNVGFLDGGIDGRRLFLQTLKETTPKFELRQGFQLFRIYEDAFNHKCFSYTDPPTTIIRINRVPKIGKITQPGDIEVVATRILTPDIQLTFDYATTELHMVGDEVFNCLCDSDMCRKTINGFIGLPEALKKYLYNNNWLTPHLMKFYEQNNPEKQFFIPKPQEPSSIFWMK